MGMVEFQRHEIKLSNGVILAFDVEARDTENGIVPVLSTHVIGREGEFNVTICSTINMTSDLRHFASQLRSVADHIDRMNEDLQEYEEDED